MNKAEQQKEQIKHLNQAAKRHAGMSFLSLTYKGHHTLVDVVHEAMESYTLACLERAARNAITEYPGCHECGGEVDKGSITNKDNLG